jgi:peptidoglycan/LPS O-acetylase OafA/YrhL
MDGLDHSPLLVALYVAGLYCAMAVLALWLVRYPKIDSLLGKDTERYGGIDGLRGLLAGGVFIHHSEAAYRYFATGVWGWGQSATLNHLGQTTVALFFMITAFLFASRLFKDGVNWRRLYIARVMRIMPLYLLFMVLVVGSAFHLSDWVMREPAAKVAAEVAHWFAFSMFARPDINGVANTWTQGGGVNWSLAYEWYFYASLPVLFFVLKPLRPPQPARVGLVLFCLALAAMGAAGVVLSGWKLHWMHFACGCAAALVYRDATLRAALPRLGWPGVACLAALTLFTSAAGAMQVLLTFAFFLSVLGRNQSALDWKPLRWLGEISYGVYLLHGFVLFWALHYFPLPLANIGVFAYMLLMTAVVAGVVLIASATHFLIELPGIALGKRMVRTKAVLTAVGVPAEATALSSDEVQMRSGIE